MDIFDLFINKNKETNVKFITVKDRFQSKENKDKLSHNLYREIYLSNNQSLFNKIQEKVNKYVELWISNGKLDKLKETNSYSINDPELQLNYYNKLFIDTFKNAIINYNTMESEIINNPYKHIIEYKKINNDNKEINIIKKISDLTVEDYNYITFNNYNDINNVNTNFNTNYHKIPYYEKALYKHNYDILDMGSFRERKLINNNYKRYNNNELINNVDYLRKNKK
jgi:hypothetical protein